MPLTPPSTSTLVATLKRWLQVGQRRYSVHIEAGDVPVCLRTEHVWSRPKFTCRLSRLCIAHATSWSSVSHTFWRWTPNTMNTHAARAAALHSLTTSGEFAAVVANASRLQMAQD